jgi:hypothetical protein
MKPKHYQARAGAADGLALPAAEDKLDRAWEAGADEEVVSVPLSQSATSEAEKQSPQDRREF